MAYFDQPTMRWDCVAGIAVGLAVGFILLDPLTDSLVESCFWEAGCKSSQAPRFVGVFAGAFGTGALSAWAIVALVKRLLRGSR